MHRVSSRAKLRGLLVGWLLLVGAVWQPAGAATASFAVQGRVEDDAGRPLAGADLRLYAVLGARETGALQLAGRFPPPPLAEAKSDAAGSYRIPVPAPGVYRLVASREGKASRQMMLQPAVEETWLPAAALAADSPLTLTVVDAAGKPIAGVGLVGLPQRGVVRFLSSWELVPVRTVTDEHGVVVLHRRSSERFDVSAAAPGLAVAEAKGVGGSLRLQLTAGSPRQLLVVGRNGQPAADAAVMAAGGLPLGRSDKAGRVTVAVRGRDPLALQVEGAGGELARVTLVPPDPHEQPRPLRVELEPATSVQGRVIDAASRQPLAGAVVVAIAQPERFAVTDAAGSYTLAGVFTSGPGWLQAAAAAHFRAVVDLPQAGSTAGVAPTAALIPAGALVGSVSDPRGRPLADVEVSAAPAPDGPGRGFRRRFLAGGDPSQGLTRSDSRGRFRLSPLATDGRLRVLFRRAGYAPLIKVVAPTPAARLVELHVTLNPGARGMGRVLALDGQAVAGAKVTLERQEETSTRSFYFGREPAKPEATAESDAGGRFILSDLASGKFVLAVEASGFAPTRVPGVDVPATAGEVDLGIVRLAPGAVIEGRVVGAQGEPIAGADVYARGAGRPGGMFAMRFAPGSRAPDATTEADGAFRIVDRTPGEKVDLSVQRGGYAPGSALGVVAPTEEPVRITLAKSSSVRGRVVDEDGAGVRGANVVLSVERAGGGFAFVTTSGSTVSDDDGRFTMEGVEPGTVKLMAQAEGFLSSERGGVEVPAGRDLEGLELVMRRGATVEGVVSSPDGRPAIGASVEVVEEEGAGGMQFRFDSGAETDGDGHYRLDGVEPGSRTVVATHEEFDRAVGSLEVRAGVNHLDLRLGGGQEVSGRVSGPLGQPVGGATVMLAAPDRGWGGEHTATTDEAGLFTVPAVPDGAYTVIATHPDYAEGRAATPVTVAGAPVGGIAIELPAGAVISGLLHGLALPELTQVRVRAWSEEGGGKEGTASYDGHYRVAGVGPGSWTVTARLEAGGRQASGNVTLGEGESEASLDLDFSGGLVLSGHVRYQGKPVDGAIIFLRGNDQTSFANTRTDFAGAYRVENLRAGSYDLEVFSPQSGLHHDEKITLEADRQLDFELRAIKVGGRVLEAGSGEPVAGARLHVEAADEQDNNFPFMGDVSSDDTGAFSVAVSGEGSWRLTVDKGGYAQATATVQVSDQPVDGVEIRLQPTAGLLLQVARAAGAPPNAVQVAVLDGAGRATVAGSYTTGENGRVRLATVPAGTWEVLVNCADSATVSLVATSPGPPVPVLLPPQASLSVRVPALAGTDALTKVSLIAADGRPFRFISWGSVDSEATFANGRTVLYRLPTGSWTVRVTHPDGRRWEATATTAAGAETTVELR